MTNEKKGNTMQNLETSTHMTSRPPRLFSLNELWELSRHKPFKACAVLPSDEVLPGGVPTEVVPGYTVQMVEKIHESFLGARLRGERDETMVITWAVDERIWRMLP
jgi:hypothetical protein